MALPSGEIFPGLPRLGLLLLLLDRSQTSGGRCGAPAGSAKVSREARDATLARPRLLSRLPDDRREGGERESSPAPKRPKFSCSNVCVLSVHSIKMHTFSQKELSPPHSINAVPLAPPQCSAGPHPTQVIAAHPTTEQLKPLRQFISAWKVIPGISRWLLNVIERGYTLQFRRRPPRFNGVVQSLTSPRNAQALRQEIGCLLEKGAVERVPPHELESGFYSRYFVVPKRDGGASPNFGSQTHQQSALRTSVQDVNAEADPGADSPRGLVCVRGFEGRVLSHSDSAASQTVSEVCFREHSVPILCSPVRAGFGPAHIFKVRGCSTFPPQSGRDAHPKLSGRLADFSSVPGHATQPYRLAAYSPGVPRAMCEQAKEHSRPESVHSVSGSLHGLPRNESPPLARARGGHFVLPAPFQRRQLCSSERISETTGTHGVSFGSVSSGLITHATTAAVAENSSPLDSMDLGTFEYRGHPRLHRSSGSVAQPEFLQPGSPPGVGDLTRGGHNRRIDARLGSGVRGDASFGAVVRASDPVAHKPIGIGSSIFSSEGVSSTTGTAACTDSHRQHVCSLVHKSPGRRPFEGFVQAGSDVTAMGGFSPSIHQSNAHPRSFESRGGHAFKEENSSRGMEVTPRVGSDDLEPLRGSRSGFIRYERECTLPVVLLSVPLPVGRGRAHSALADSQALCVSSDQDIASGVMQDQGGASVRHTHSSELAEPALVSGPDRAADSPPLADSGQEGHVISGGRLGVAPEPRTMEPSCVVASGLSGELDALQARVVDTLTEARAPSTRRLYALKWGVFVKWCHQAHIDPVVCTVLDVLSFLQYRLDSGSLPSTLKVYVAAIAAFRSPQGGQSIGRDPMVVSFLKGARRLHPPRPPSVPPWDLEVVLRALSQPPFEPLSSVGLKELSLKTALLLALASAKRIGDLHAFSVDSDCIRFGPGDCSITLRPRMGYVPKSLSTPFKIQTVSLSALSSESAASSEADAQTSVCPVRALRIYIDRSASFRQSNQLFVCYGGCARGRAVSKQRLSHWIVDAITAAYTNQGLECPLHIRGHSTRAMASSWAWSRGMSIQDICVAAGWSSENTFARFYRLDVQSFASQVLSVSGWCMFTTLFALHTLLLIRLFCPVLSADSCICVVLSSDTFIMLGWGHAIQSVQFLMLVVQVALFQRSQRYFYPDMQICIPLG